MRLLNNFSFNLLEQDIEVSMHVYVWKTAPLGKEKKASTFLKLTLSHEKLLLLQTWRGVCVRYIISRIRGSGIQQLDALNWQSYSRFNIPDYFSQYQCFALN